jgi:methyl-accepting chemotaxis protein
MRFGRRATALLIGTAILILTTVAVVGNALTTHLLETAHEGDYELMRQVLANSLRSAEDKALVRAELVESIPSVHQAFLAGDRARLLAECKPMFDEQSEKYGLDQSQFHTPGGVSFLRLHKPELFGDAQVSYRQMLNDVHQNKVLRKGVVITKAGPAVSGIVPIFGEGGKFAGSFEMGLELDPVLDRMKEAYGIEAAVFFEEKQLKEIATDLPGDVISPKNRVGKYIRYHATHVQLATALVQDRDVEITEPKHYVRSVAGTPWGVQLVPLYNYANKQIGVVSLSMSFAADKRDANRARVWLSLTTVVGILIMSGMVLIVIRGLLLRPLAVISQRFEALASGDASQPAPPTDGEVDELQSLAQSYERIRHGRGA